MIRLSPRGSRYLIKSSHTTFVVGNIVIIFVKLKGNFQFIVVYLLLILSVLYVSELYTKY